MLRGLVLFALGAYRAALSPLLGPACRFYPSCSAYAIEAVMGNGVFPGLWLALKRILRCHPFHPGGYDPVPHDVGRNSGHKDTKARRGRGQESPFRRLSSLGVFVPLWRRICSS